MIYSYFHCKMHMFHMVHLLIFHVGYGFELSALICFILRKFQKKRNLKEGVFVLTIKVPVTILSNLYFSLNELKV